MCVLHYYKYHHRYGLFAMSINVTKNKNIATITDHYWEAKDGWKDVSPACPNISNESLHLFPIIWEFVELQTPSPVIGILNQ